MRSGRDLTGDFVLAGEAAGLIHDIVPAGQLLRRIADQAADTLHRRGKAQMA